MRQRSRGSLRASVNAERPGDPDPLTERADGEQPGVAGGLSWRRLDDEWCAEEVEDLGSSGGYNLRRLPWEGKGPRG
jgi:hypothetical protein